MALETSRPIVAWCLEIHDLWISKAVAGRPKDMDFCSALRKAGAVDAATLLRRLATVPGLGEETRKIVQRQITQP